MSEELKMAIVAVSTKGLAPFARVSASLPKQPVGAAYQRWVERQARVAGEVAERLTKQGARIDQSDRAATIVFAGVEAMSTLGLYQALKNWNAKARKQMRAINRGDRK